ncbi:MAG TPA: cytochrome c1 [Sphingobium sp.]|uniref:cytochrome c1 n=1 Tax=Sphingobium sp. TaxID=1912891 RepID=UPI002ED022BE
MVRLIAALVGIFFSGMLLYSFGSGAVAYISEPPAATAEHEFHLHPKEIEWSFNGPLGHYDRQQLQRGFQVFSEVCSACHSLRLVAFRDLKDLGYNEAEIKAIAKNWKIKTPDVDPKTGEPSTRPPVPADKFPLVFANDVAARAANNNAVPPDLSLMTKSRHDGSNYVHSLLTGYQAQPAALLKEFPDSKTPEGLHYNPYFANLNLAMPPPLTAEGQVTYGEGQPKPTVDQMSQDVAAFLTWTAEPKMEARKSAGLAVVFFLLVATVLAYMSYQTIWAGKKH